ncbi:phage holin family protein [Nocardioides sp. GY 10113]|uniref:phage holin family protein n=1 Tax=Nocardioides sp. GY 10113 TaxID=2569761 RepID=UPI00145834A7|nr:phage holin family protein [Nocardioides sp. GY 10113]
MADDRRRWWRPHFTLGDLGRAALSLLGGAVGVMVASWIVPGFSIGEWWRAFSVAISVAIWGFLLRPVLVRLAVYLGWVGSALAGIFGQAFIIWLAVLGEEGVEDSLLGALVASWIIATVGLAFGWLATAGTEDAVTARMLRRARRRPVTVPDPDVPGILFVQMDGVPFPVLEWHVRAGTLPTLSRWIRSGEYRMAEWRPKLPATTPASQMGILHGTIEGIPAFRWVDRAEGKVYVANKPADAALIEARHSDGRGLLADDGVSVSNLFTGDAPTAYVTMSAVGRTQETKETRAALASFLASPNGLARSIPLMVGEVVRERFQARRAIRRDIQPRVHRGRSFVAERAALAGVLRDLNTSLVADAMLKGRRSIYVDYVDYDGIAHHVGMVRPEAVAALSSIDAILGRLEEVAKIAPRTYHLVVLSDHGQSQGATFADRYGEDLAAVVARLADASALGTDRNSEGAGSVQSVLASSASDDSVLGRALARTTQRMSDVTFAEADDAHEAEAGGRAGGGEQKEQFLVFGSGNLGLVYVAGEDHRLTLQELTDRFPALVPGLIVHPGVGFVVVDTTEYGPVAFGARGEHRVRDGVVVGEDPLAPFGPHAAEFVLRAASMPETPDLYVNSLVDELGEVAAFEGLVGCHGGLGGWQDRAMLVHPTELAAPDQMIVGADALHEVLVGWLEDLGHRTELRDRTAPVPPPE